LYSATVQVREERWQADNTTDKNGVEVMRADWFIRVDFESVYGSLLFFSSFFFKKKKSAGGACVCLILDFHVCIEMVVKIVF
jgi:hypothetical protein